MKTIAAAVLLSSLCALAGPPPVEEVSPNGKTSIMETPMMCPTKSKRAREVYNQGKDAEEAGQLPEAIKLFESAVKADPKYCDAMDNLGLSLRRTGKIDEAIGWYRKSIAILPKNGTSRMNLAAALRMKKAYAESAVEYQALIDLIPDDPEGYYGLATVKFDLNKDQEAVVPLLEAEKLYLKINSPYAPDAQRMLGGAYYRLEQWPDAVKYLTLAVEATPVDPKMNLMLGTALVKNKKAAAAKPYLMKAKGLGAPVPPDIATAAGL